MKTAARFFRCTCQRLHIDDMITHETRCRCGASLWDLIH